MFGFSGRSSRPQMDEPQQLDLAVAAGLPVADVLGDFGSSDQGLSRVEVGRRRAVYGPNVLLSRGVSALSVLVRQLRSYPLLLLLFAAVVSAVVGDRTEALIIVGIMAMSVGLSFFNDYRSEKAVEALHSQIRHVAVCRSRRAGEARPAGESSTPRLAVARIAAGFSRLLTRAGRARCVHTQSSRTDHRS